MVRIGYALLIPALLALLVAGVVLPYRTWESGLSQEDTDRLMRDAAVPKRLIFRANSGDYLSDERKAELTLRQRWAYGVAGRRHEPLWDVGVGMAIIGLLFLLGAALVVAIAGATLVRKMDVLACGEGGAGSGTPG